MDRGVDRIVPEFGEQAVRAQVHRLIRHPEASSSTPATIARVPLARGGPIWSNWARDIPCAAWSSHRSDQKAG